MGKTADLLPGTLDMLILKAVSLKPLHGYGVLLRIRQISGEALDIPQGSLYPALYRLEHQGLISTEWGQRENNRRAKFYTVTAAGRRRLREETADWNRLARAIAAALNTSPAGVGRAEPPAIRRPRAGRPPPIRGRVGRGGPPAHRDVRRRARAPGPAARRGRPPGAARVRQHRQRGARLPRGERPRRLRRAAARPCVTAPPDC